MTLTEQRKLAKHVCRLLKVSEITFPLGRTPKGNLGLTFNANNDEYEIMLDSIPLSTKNSLEDENNIELKAMIEKYYFDGETHVVFKSQSVGMTTGNMPEIETIAAKTIEEVSRPKAEKPAKVTKTKK